MSLNEIKIPKNMNYQKEALESKNLDHLGIVEKINEIFLVDSLRESKYRRSSQSNHSQ